MVKTSIPERQERKALSARDNLPRLKFVGGSDFQTELRHRVEALLRSRGRPLRGGWRMYLKSAVILAGFAAAYVALVFFAKSAWQAFPLAVLLGLAAAAIGFDIMHDASHKAYSEHAWINRLMAATLDLVGGSSYLWHWKHVVLHHTYVNVSGYDTDIDLGGVARLTPDQKRLPFQRWQQWYIWPLYGFVAIRWHLIGDFQELITGRVGGHRVPRPKGRELAIFIAGKLIFGMIAFGIPLLFHPLWIVALFYGVTTIVLGTVMSVVFQLAHCVEEAEFPVPAEPGRMNEPWAVHQVETTVDFARRSRVLAWLLGGLNYQIEHHLFTRISHVNYPAITDLVEQTCREFGVRYSAHRTLFAGIRSHFRYLQRMGAASAA